MKNLLASTVAALALLTAANAQAAARAPSNFGKDYVEGSDALSRWSLGGYYDSIERKVDISGMKDTMDDSRALLTVGYDVLPWMMPYAAIGESQSKFQYSESDGENLTLAVGLLFNLLDHEIPDSGLLEDRVRVNASVEYAASEADYRSDSIKWGALNASLTLGIVNDVAGAFIFVPDSIALYGGPIYSSLLGSDVELADGESEFGLALGLEIYYTPRVSLFTQANFLDSTGVTAGLNVHF